MKKIEVLTGGINELIETLKSLQDKLIIGCSLKDFKERLNNKNILDHLDNILNEFITEPCSLITYIENGEPKTIRFFLENKNAKIPPPNDSCFSRVNLLSITDNPHFTKKKQKISKFSKNDLKKMRDVIDKMYQEKE